MTAQAPEIIWYKGQQEALCQTPLAYYFNRRRRKPPNFIAPHTALWRGYIGEWVVENNALYLRNLTNYSVKDCPDFDWREIFKGQQGDIKATWYSGELRIVKGKCLYRMNAWFVSLYETEILLTVQEGNVTDTKEIDNTCPNKFDAVPRDDETRIIASEKLWLDKIQCLYEKWYWDGVAGESLVFADEDVADWTDEHLEFFISRANLLEALSQVTVSRNKSGFTFVNFNFKTS
jgi:hypothetical protein